MHNHYYSVAHTLYKAGAECRRPALINEHILCAIKNAEHERLKSLLALESDIGLKADGVPRIHLATVSLEKAMNRDIEHYKDLTTNLSDRFHTIVKILLDTEDADKQNETGDTAINAALRNPYAYSIFQTLLQHGVNIHLTDKNGIGPAHLAAAFGNLDAIKALASRGLDLNAESSDKETLLSLAASNGHMRVLEYLLEQLTKASPNENLVSHVDTCRLVNAIQACDEVAFKLALEAKPRLQVKDRDGQSLLHLACRHGNEAMMQKVLELGADVNAQDSKGNTPLHTAALSPHSIADNVKLLVSHGALIRQRNYPREVAIRPTIFITLLKGKPDRATALHLAAYSGNLSATQALLAAAEAETVVHKDGAGTYAELGSCGVSGLTALMLAAQEGHVAVAKALIAAGADVNAPGWAAKDSANVLDYADRSANVSMIQLIKSHGGGYSNWEYRARVY